MLKMNKMYEIKDVAIRLNRHPVTFRRDIKALQSKFPKDPALHTYIGKRLKFTDQHIKRIVELCSQSKQDQI
ncbi:hypothetical protein [uncultured Mediterranean phage]|nr:hypothetical protein [uncultured Mediterranean phage]